MNENIFTRVKTCMKSKDYTFNESWLRECVQYCAETHPKLSVEGIQSFAVEQWLLSNLREINNENGCLPKNLAEQKFTILNGSYILQMERMYDISTSKFKQLEKIRNANVENLKVTNDVKLDSWEPKGKRIFQLFLTDGVQEIQAIEYKPIELFNETLLPGYKLKITGPVTFRRGIIMLENKSIFGIGGEIEDLLIPNSLENVLARFLNLEENLDPYNDTKRKEDSEKFDLEEEYLNDLEKLARSQDSKENERSNSNLNNSSNFNPQSGFKLNLEKTLTNQNVDELLSDDELEALLNDPDIVDEFPSMDSIQKANDNVKQIDKASFFKAPSLPSSRMTHKIKCNSENPNSIVCQSIQNQEFLDNSFYLDDKDWDSSKLQNNFTDKGDSDYHKIIQKIKIIENLKPNDLPSSEFPDDNLILEDEDLIILEPSAAQISKLSNNEVALGIQKSLNEKNFEPKNSYKSFFSKSNSLKTDKSMDSDVDLGSEFNKNWQIISNKVSIVKSNVIQRPFLEAKKYLNENIFKRKNSFGTSKPFKSLHSKPSSVISDKSDVHFEVKKLGNKHKEGSQLFFDERSNSSGVEMDLEIKESSNESNNNLEIMNTDLHLRLEKLLNKPNNYYFQSNKAPISKLTFQQTENSYGLEKVTSKIRSIDSPSRFRTEIGTEEIPIRSKRPASLVLSLTTNHPKMLRASDSMKISEAKQKIALRNEEPPKKIFDFICDLTKEPLTDEAIFKTVRAKVKEKGKLSSKGGLWRLDGLISDGTANLKVEFCSEFMENILGFTALDFSMMKKRVKTDPKLEEQIRKNMRDGQHKLEQTDWLMQLELIKNKIPLVVKVSELTQEQKKVFEERLQTLKPQYA